MQKAVIIFIVVVFLISTIGLYIGLLATPTDPRSQSRDNATINESPDRAELPDYVRAEGVNVRDMTDATDQDGAVVEIGDDFFNPTVLKISPGTTVVWHNTSPLTHSVTSDPDSPNGGLDSGQLENSESYTYIFEQAGTYNYYCDTHPIAMRAVIEVVE